MPRIIPQHPLSLTLWTTVHHTVGYAIIGEVDISWLDEDQAFLKAIKVTLQSLFLSLSKLQGILCLHGLMIRT